MLTYVMMMSLVTENSFSIPFCMSQRVKRYLTSHGIRKGLWFDPDGRHGQAMLSVGQKEILRWLVQPDETSPTKPEIATTS